MENMYAKADDLDPQPEFPLRTELTFYEQIEQPASNLDVVMNRDSIPAVGQQQAEPSNETPVLTLFSLWIFGLIVWCVVFVNQGGAGGIRKPKKRSKVGGSSGYKNV